MGRDLQSKRMLCNSTDGSKTTNELQFQQGLPKRLNVPLGIKEIAMGLRHMLILSN